MEKDLYSLIQRKWNSFKRDPIGSVEYKTQATVIWLLSHWASHKLRQKGALDILLNFHMDRPSSAFPPDFIDLWFLYQIIRCREPNIILEFGSGCSTIILAQALWDNQCHSPENSGYLYSIDANLFWAEATAKSMPTHLRNFCRITYSPLLEVEYSGTLGFRHVNVPDVVPNFLYLDGPPLTSVRKVAIDVLDMEDKLPQDFYMVIDDRKENTTFLKKTCEENTGSKRDTGDTLFVPKSLS